MASTKKNNSPQQDPEEKIESAIGRTESFIIQNGKLLLSILAVVVLAAGGYMWWKYVQQPRQWDKAGEMMFVAEQHFAAEDYALALNGDGNNPGFLDVIDRYGNTPQGNIANHYAGICYMQRHEYDNALLYLGRYKHTIGAPNEIINAQNLGLQGDVLVQKGELAQAADKYAKAVEAGDNSLTAPYYLKKLGLVYVELGNSKDALAAFQRIADQYKQSTEGRDIDKYIGTASQI